MNECLPKLLRAIAGSTEAIERKTDVIFNAAALEIECLHEALNLALDMRAPLEPPDSRAVSNEFVAMAAVSFGDTSPKVMDVIRNAKSETIQ